MSRKATLMSGRQLRELEETRHPIVDESEDQETSEMIRGRVEAIVTKPWPLLEEGDTASAIARDFDNLIGRSPSGSRTITYK